MKKIIALILCLCMFFCFTFYSSAANDIRGDVNRDAAVDSDDSIYLLRYSLSHANFPIYQDADFNKDNTIDSDDAVYLLNHVFDPLAYPLPNTGTNTPIIPF